MALLRGINVGTARRVAMADLRSLLEGLGYLQVRTLLNSGNVVFVPPRPGSAEAAASIEKALTAKLRIQTRVTVLTAREVESAVRDNPFSGIAVDPARLLITVPRDPGLLPRLEPLLERRWSPEALAVAGRVAYLWCHDGLIGSPLWTAVERVLGAEGTARNLSTMTKLLALVRETQGRETGPRAGRPGAKGGRGSTRTRRPS